MIHDLVDLDFSYVVLGRDLKGIFRCVDLGTSFELKRFAREHLLASMKQIYLKGDQIFPQGDEKGKKNELIQPIVPIEKCHRHFNTLLSSDRWSCARELITEIAYAFTDPDKNYIREFQTNGFNSRLWELFLFSLFHEEGFRIQRSYTAPGYHLTKFGEDVFVEALTLNPGQDMPGQPGTPQEIFQLNDDFMPIRYSNALMAKLNRARENKVDYWDLEHVKGKPLVFAVHDYTWDNSMTWSRDALETYLYGFRHRAVKQEDGSAQVVAEKVLQHKWNTKIVESGFFLQPNSEYVSAVLFSNNGTLTKFNRMGLLAGYGDQNILMVRSGWTFENASGKRENYSVKVEKGIYSEEWAEGVMMYHNPKAKHPIAPGLFPCINHINIDEGGNFLSLFFQEKFTVESVTSISLQSGDESRADKMEIDEG